MILLVAVVQATDPRASRAEPPAPSPSGRLAWFREAKFGLFIHWGLYALPGGVWQGTDYPFVGEWIMKWAHIPKADYEALAGRFNPRRFDPEAVAQLAKDAGMKYVVITAKHHDGFSMFDSRATKFDIVDATPYKKDPLAPLGAACARRGLKYGFYYSQAQDWNEPNAAGNDWDFSTPVATRNPAEYLQRKVMPQLEELLTHYGPLGLFWFDTPTLLTKENVLALERLVRTKQPSCAINSRLGHDLGDYRQMGDNMVPSDVYPFAWEVPATLNDTWGWKTRDRHWKSATQLIYRLVDVVSKGGNYLLNVGPDAEGTVPAESADRLRAVGRWLERHGEAIYGTTHSPFSVNGQPWRMTAKPGFIYVHLVHWPAGGRFVLTGLRNPVLGAFLLSDPTRTPLTVTREQDRLVVVLPGDVADAHLPVLALRIEGEPDVDPALRWDASRERITLLARDANTHGPSIRYAELDQTASGFAAERDTLMWHLLVNRAGRFKVEVEYSAPDGASDTFEYRAFGASLRGRAAATAGELRWSSLGTLDVKAAGLDQTSLRLVAPQPATASAIQVRGLRLTRVR